MFRNGGGEWVLPNGANALDWVDTFHESSELDKLTEEQTSAIFQFIMWTIMAITTLAVLVLVIVLLVYFAPVIRPLFTTLAAPFILINRRLKNE
jgi:ABC-type bacteriocin/lantibiotic exporter with double-glycine peptidase domain